MTVLGDTSLSTPEFPRVKFHRNILQWQHGICQSKMRVRVFGEASSFTATLSDVVDLTALQ